MSRIAIGPRSKGRFTITLPDALREKCEAEAERMELSLSGYFRRLAELRHGTVMTGNRNGMSMTVGRERASSVVLEPVDVLIERSVDREIPDEDGAQ